MFCDVQKNVILFMIFILLKIFSCNRIYSSNLNKKVCTVQYNYTEKCDLLTNLDIFKFI